MPNNNQNQSCDSNTQTCESTQSCSTEASCPVDESVAMWKKNFCVAMQSVAVDLLKEKIIAKWGDTLDKQAEATVEALGAQWCAKIQAAKAECGLREGIKASYCESDKCEGDSCESK
jgi:hypothetical protein